MQKSSDKKKIIVWVESVVGGGHLQAADQLATSLMQKGFETHVISPSQYRSAEIVYGGAQIHTYGEDLRIYHDAQLGYVTPNAVPLDQAKDFMDNRFHAFMRIVEKIHPDAILTEHWPFGRGNMDPEIYRGIVKVKTERPEILLYGSVRDVMLVASGESGGGSARSAAEIINKHFDRIFVHSDPNFISFDQTFPCAVDIQDKLTYTGYLVHPMPQREAMDEIERPVLVSSGGGKTVDGLALYETSIRSQKLLSDTHPLKHRPWMILVSLAYDEDVFRNLQIYATRHNPEITIRRNLTGDGFRRQVSNSALCISLSGYNTVIETYAADVPAVLLPYYNAAQGQLFRANAFSCLGKLVVLPQEDRRNPEKLIALIDETLAKKDIVQHPLRLNGEVVVAETIAADFQRGYRSNLVACLSELGGTQITASPEFA